MTSDTTTKKTMSEHEHCWKYIGTGLERVCEAPIPTIESCGERQIKHTEDCCGEGWETL